MLGNLRKKIQCQHLQAERIYGDEINWTGGKRGFCGECGTWLDALPQSLDAIRGDTLREARGVITQYLASAEDWRYNRVVWAFGIMLGEIPEDTPEPRVS